MPPGGGSSSTPGRPAISCVPDNRGNLSPERRLGAALRLPTFEIAGLTLYKRLALIADAGRIAKVFYPVFPPDANAGDVLAWLEAR